MIPQCIRDFKTFIVAYSGGKDSTATLLWALENLPHERMRVIYYPVGVIDPPENREYLPYIESVTGVMIEVVKAGDRPLPPIRGGRARADWQNATSFFDMVRMRGMWPDWKNRYCTTYLKQWPCALYAAELSWPVLIIGQRRSESKNREKLPFFSGKRDWKRTRDGLPIYRPILKWSEKDVWSEIEMAGIKPNPVYERSSRCNCLICFSARKQEVFTACRLYPEVIGLAVGVEKAVDHKWRVNQTLGAVLEQARNQIGLPGFAMEMRAGA